VETAPSIGETAAELTVASSSRSSQLLLPDGRVTSGGEFPDITGWATGYAQLLCQ